MKTVTVRLPDDKHTRLRRLAEHKGVSLNKLINEFATVALAQHDAETRFHALAAKGSAKRGAKLLDKLGSQFDALLDRMQTANARAGMRAAFRASPKQLGKAAVAFARRRSQPENL